MLVWAVPPRQQIQGLSSPVGAVSGCGVCAAIKWVWGLYFYSDSWVDGQLDKWVCEWVSGWEGKGFPHLFCRLLGFLHQLEQVGGLGAGYVCSDECVGIWMDIQTGGCVCEWVAGRELHLGCSNCFCKLVGFLHQLEQVSGFGLCSFHVVGGWIGWMNE